MNFFISDTHFNHTNIIKYCNRPFITVTEMNETLINNWNKKIKDNDTVYHLGDFGFGDWSLILKRLKGNILFIKGSHDKKSNAPYMRVVRIKNTTIILCHYALRVWQASHYNSWHLYGHSHGMLPPQGKSWDMSVENTNYEPLSFEEIKVIMDKRPDNVNLVKNR